MAEKRLPPCEYVGSARLHPDVGKKEGIFVKTENTAETELLLPLLDLVLTLE
jgi:hypothetical protein